MRNVLILVTLFFVSFACAVFACWIYFDYRMTSAYINARRDAQPPASMITRSESPAPFFFPEPETQNEPAEPYARRPIVLSFVGDCTLGQEISASQYSRFSSVYEKNSPEYFFGAVRHIFEADDFTVANCEGTFTESASPRAKAEDGPKYWMRGAPEYAGIFSAGGIDAVNLANNHTMDFGDDGYEDTKNALEAAGVEYFGRDTLLIKEIRGLKIGFFGLSASSGTATIKQRISALREQGAEAIIASFHGGLPESHYTPTASQISAARAAIDNGALAVVEHHPHVLQGIELYKNGVIAYSLGNFCFGGNVNPLDKDTMIFQLELYEEPGGIKFDYRAIPASVSSSERYNDFRPRILEGGDALRVDGKIRRLSKELAVVTSDEPQGGSEEVFVD